MGTTAVAAHREPWNKGKIVGQKAPFKLKDIWALRVRLQMESRVRELALLNLGIDSKLRGCDLVALKVRDVCHGDQVATRAIVMQHKTQRPVQFEITQATRDALQAGIKQAGLKPEDFLFPSRLHDSPHLGTRQYARILGHWVDELGLDRDAERSRRLWLRRPEYRRQGGAAGAREDVDPSSVPWSWRLGPCTRLAPWPGGGPTMPGRWRAEARHSPATTMRLLPLASSTHGAEPSKPRCTPSNSSVRSAPWTILLGCQVIAAASAAGCQPT